MYRALYRKWRPQRFADVVGQENSLSALSQQIAHQRVGHAYLFTGTRGTGKTTLAKLFAKAINCENRQGTEPCGLCAPCKGTEDGTVMDVVEIDAASNNGVNDVRNLIEGSIFYPSRCLYKVYIIDEVHMLSGPAFNALLKTLEEPPAHVVFILATTESHKLPATILSRCQRFDFTRISASKMAQRVQFVAQQENIQLSEQAANLIARLADGALRDALSLLDTCSSLGTEVDEAVVRRMAGVADKNYLFTLSDAIAQQQLATVFEQVALLREQSIDVRRLTEELISHYRFFILAKAKPDGSLLESLDEAEKQRVLAYAKDIAQETAVAAVRRLAQALNKMGQSMDPRTELELALFDLAQPPQPALQAPLAVSAPPPAPKAVLAKATAARPAVPLSPASENSQNLPPFALWPQAVQRMEQVNNLLFAYMQDSKAYIEGKRVLIEGSDMFLSFMRKDEQAAAQIKAILAELTGSPMSIGPYKASQKPQEETVSSAHSTLQEWQNKGVPVEYV